MNSTEQIQLKINELREKYERFTLCDHDLKQIFHMNRPMVLTFWWCKKCGCLGKTIDGGITEWQEPSNTDDKDES